MTLDEPLRPKRYTTPTLFSIDVTSISLKDMQQHLEHPFFALSTLPNRAIRCYSDNHGNKIEVTPSSLGMPTILDKDILIYAISNIMHCRNLGEAVSRRVVIYSAEMLRFANRNQSGKDYKALERSLLRLAGCVIKTNIATGDMMHTQIFSLLDSADLKRKHDTHGRLMHCEITLSEWLWRAIEANQVLTLHADYFRLRRPLERRLYEIARKHCGRQPSWNIGLSRLHEKSAVLSPLKNFRLQIRKIVRDAAKRFDYLPGYTIEFDDEADQVTFCPRPDAPIHLSDSMDKLDQETWDSAVELAPDYDIRELNRQWLAWRVKRNLPPPRHAPSAFLGFVKAFALRRQNAAAAGKPDPRPDSETIAPNLLAWWQGLPDDRRNALEGAHRAYQVQGDTFFRSDKQLIERAVRVGLPKGL